MLEVSSVTLPPHLRTGIQASFGPLLVSLSVFLWNQEEPSKLATLAVLLTVYFLGAVLIAYGRHVGIVVRWDRWHAVWVSKIVLTVLITKYFWVLTLGPWLLDENFFDPAAYDYYGRLVADDGLNLEVLQRGGGLTAGIALFIGSIYLTFGTSTLYVAAFNCVFCLVTAMSVCGILAKALRSQDGFDGVRWIMLFPEILYYDALPAKESVSTALFYAAIFFALLFCTEKVYRYIVLSILLASAVALFRPTFGLLAAGCSAFVMLLGPQKISLRAFILGILLVFAGGMSLLIFPELAEALAFAQRIEFANAVLENVPSASPVKQAINELLVPSSAVNFVAFVPLRMMLLLFGPFPFIFPDFDAIQNFKWAHGQYDVWLQEFVRISAILIIWLSISHRRVLQAWGHAPRVAKVAIFGIFLIVLLVVSNNAFFIHLRYRYLLDPIFLAAIYAIRTLRKAGGAEQ